MVRSPHTWTLEQTDRRLVFATGSRLTLFAESRPFHVTRHRHPAWKAVLPLTGHALIRPDGGPTVEAPGLIVPPQLPHTSASTSPFVALFADPWQLPPAPGPVPLDTDAVRRLLASLGPTDDAGPVAVPDLDAAFAELLTRTGRPPSPPDPRVTHAVQAAQRPGVTTPLEAIAAEVGLSPSRLRTLVRESAGVPLTVLRLWGRLRSAVAALPDAPVAATAADAGFADQSHLTRTARRLIGRTPGSLTGTSSAPVDPGCLFPFVRWRPLTITSREAPMEIMLREVRDADLPVFFTQMNDPEGIRMAAFTAKDPSDSAHFQAHWARIRQDPAVITRTVVGDSGEIVGHAAVFGPPEEREVTYWIGRPYWGRGAATAALRELLGLAPERPLHARVAADNVGSIQVLKKCGFVVTGSERDFANGRGEEVDEVLFTLLA